MRRNEIPDVAIELAMKDSCGDAGGAAKALGISRARLASRISRNPLLARAQKKLKDEAAVMEAGQGPEVGLPERRELRQQERHLTKENLLKLGVSQQVVDRLNALGGFDRYTAETLHRTMSLCHSGNVFSTLKLFDLLNDVNENHLHAKPPAGASAEELIEFERIKQKWAPILVTMAAEIRKQFGQTMTSLAVMAKMAQMGKSRGKKDDKPGFSPADKEK